jgi:hypothetical protein
MTDDATRPIETQLVEPADDAAPIMDADTAAVTPLAPTSPVAARATGGGRGRWVIAGLVAAVALAGTIGAVLLFGQQSTPVALQYIPGDAVAVAELRLDLPGDQLQHLGNLLAHFPGFADQSTLAAKLDEALAKLIESGAGSDLNYQADVKPWLSGPTFMGVLGITADATEPTDEDIVISATTNGAASCASVFKDEAVTHETYRNLDVVISADGSMACVLDGRQALLGNTTSVHNALDAKAAGTGMDSSAGYKAARAALGGDRLVTMYIDGESIAKMVPTPSEMPVPGLGSFAGNVPAWIMGGVRAEDDALVLDFVSAPTPAATAGPSLVAVPAAHASVITQMLPGDTLAYLEAQGAGASLQNLLTELRQIPEMDEALKVLDGVGGAGELIGWVDDLGLAVSMHGETPDVAALLVTKDEATATTKIAAVKSLLGLMGAGSGFEIKDSTVNGVTVTTITLTDLGSIVPPGSVPGLGDLPTGPVSFSIAADGRTIVLASGEAAMSAILNTAPGASLADNAAFKHALTRGLTNARATIYLGVGATVDLATGLLPADALATYQTEAAPFVEPLEGFLLQATSDAAGNRSRLVLTVTQP